MFEDSCPQRTLVQPIPGIFSDMPRFRYSDYPVELLIPLQRTRVMMKSSPDVEFVSADSAVCLSKATEMFIRELVSAAYSNGEDSQFTYKNLSNAQSRIPRYGFLADVLPQKISAREWIDKYKAEFDASCL